MQILSLQKITTFSNLNTTYRQILPKFKKYWQSWEFFLFFWIFFFRLKRESRGLTTKGLFTVTFARKRAGGGELLQMFKNLKKLEYFYILLSLQIFSLIFPDIADKFLSRPSAICSPT